MDPTASAGALSALLAGGGASQSGVGDVASEADDAGAVRGAGPHPYHRMAGGRTRAFKLLTMGTTPASVKLRCELCRKAVQSEDPLYAGFELEWAYYKKTGEPEGAVCFYSALTHRTRYKAYSRQELKSELSSDEAFAEWQNIEKLVIDQKRKGNLQMDLNSLPIPAVVVEKMARSEMKISKPKRQLLDEEAFKKKHGMSFKEAGVKPEEYEVDSGVFVTGVVEQVGESGVYDIESSFSQAASKRVLVDDGRPQIDGKQGDCNFQHISKKQRLAGKSWSSQALSDLVSAAHQKKADAAAKGAAAAPSGDSVHAEDGGAKGEGDGPDGNDDDLFGERAAEAALGCLAAAGKRGRKAAASAVKGKGAKPAPGADGGVGGPAKKAKSSSSLVTATAKFQKELAEVLQKFKEQKIQPGPLANKLKGLKTAHAKLLGEIEGRDDEAATTAISASDSLIETIETIGSVLTTYAAAKNLFGAVTKLKGHVDKQPALDFFAEARALAGDATLKKATPAVYFELMVKIQCWRAVQESAGEPLREALAFENVKFLFDFSDSECVAMQRTVVSKLMMEAMCSGSHGAISDCLIEWMTVLTEPRYQDEFGNAALARELQLVAKVVKGQPSEADLAELKGLTSGPGFQFRVSKLGAGMVAKAQTDVASTRNLQVFDRRWGQLQGEVGILAQGERGDGEEFLAWLDRILPVLSRIMECRKFLENAPERFWSDKNLGELVDKYCELFASQVVPPLAEDASRQCETLAESMLKFIEADAAPSDVEAWKSSTRSLGDSALFKLKPFVVALPKAVSLVHERRFEAVQALRDFFAFFPEKVATSALRKATTNQDCLAFASMVRVLHADGQDGASGDGGSYELASLFGVKSPMTQSSLLLEGVNDIFSDKAAQVVFNAAVAFNESLLLDSPVFRQRAEEADLVAFNTVWPFKVDLEDMKGSFENAGAREARAHMAAFVPNAGAASGLQELIQSWGKQSHLRELQIASKFCTFQVRLAKASEIWVGNTLLGCASGQCYLAAMSASKGSGKGKGSSSASSAVGEAFIVCDPLVEALVELATLANSLEDLESAKITLGEACVVIGKGANTKARTLATQALGEIKNCLTKRWSAALLAGAMAAVPKMPKGNWRALVVTTFDHEYVKKELLGNPNHLAMAQLCEWLEVNLKGMKTALGKLCVPYEASAVVEDTVRDIKIIVACAIAYQLILNTAADFKEKPQRESAVKDLRIALKGVATLPDEVSARLDEFVIAPLVDDQST